MNTEARHMADIQAGRVAKRRRERRHTNRHIDKLGTLPFEMAISRSSIGERLSIRVQHRYCASHSQCEPGVEDWRLRFWREKEKARAV